MGKIFNLMVVIAFAAGTLIVALTVYSAPTRRSKAGGFQMES